MSATAKKTVNRAKIQIDEGYKKFCKAFGKNTSWCQIFLWWLLALKGDIKYPKDSYARHAEKWCAKHWKKISMKDARAGDVVFFTKNGTRVSHCGMIRKKGTSKIAYTIEGNVGTPGKWKTNIVDLRTRKRSYIKSIYRPPYSSK